MPAMVTPREVVVTGLGFVTPIGQSRDEVLDSVLAARSGISLWRMPERDRTFPAGWIEDSFGERFSVRERPYLDRCSQMALLAAQQAMADARLETFAEFGTRAGLYYGTVRGGIDTEVTWVRQFYVDGRETAKPYTIMASMLNAGSALISIRHGIRGPVATHSSACASSGSAIADAFDSIRSGRVDLALAGGAEASLIPIFFGAWDGLRALARVDETDAARSCRPFSADRSGLVLSEGAAFLVLESAESALARGADIYARVAGCGIASDAYHIGSPHSRGQVDAMTAALADAGLHPGDIDYINAHATATQGGDIVETATIHTVFAEHARRIPVSSTKSIHGHMLGAASAMEFAITLLAIRGEFLPATAHLERIDPECDLVHVPNRPVLERPIRHALSFSAGFGGTNAALVASRYGA